MGLLDGLDGLGGAWPGAVLTTEWLSWSRYVGTELKGIVFASSRRCIRGPVTVYYSGESRSPGPGELEQASVRVRVVAQLGAAAAARSAGSRALFRFPWVAALS